MKRILVPCDFSPQAIDAYRYALDIAAQSKASVDLLHVIELPAFHDTVLMPVLNFEAEMLKDLKDSAEKQFEALTRKYHIPGVKIFASVEYGQPHHVITYYITKNKIDLVLMGSKGVTGVKGVLIGSNAERIVRFSPVPVLVVKRFSKGALSDIVFPNTFDNDGQDEIITQIEKLQEFFGARLHLVWINTPANFQPDPLMHRKMVDFAEKNKLKNYTVNIFNHYTEKEGILHFAESLDADLIAMSTHGRQGLAHAIHGSVAEDVVNHSSRNILTYVIGGDHF
jgi:nucleotide-binding universal stress UspA family protein